MRSFSSDQNPVNRSLIEVVLRKLGHDSFMAQDGEVAVALARQRKFDLVLMDIQMPKNVQDDRVRASV
jgi:CheY-like chemotaxis protein